MLAREWSRDWGPGPNYIDMFTRTLIKLWCVFRLSFLNVHNINMN